MLFGLGLLQGGELDGGLLVRVELVSLLLGVEGRHVRAKVWARPDGAAWHHEPGAPLPDPLPPDKRLDRGASGAAPADAAELRSLTRSAAGARPGELVRALADYHRAVVDGRVRGLSAVKRQQGGSVFCHGEGAAERPAAAERAAPEQR